MGFYDILLRYILTVSFGYRFADISKATKRQHFDFTKFGASDCVFEKILAFFEI